MPTGPDPEATTELDQLADAMLDEAASEISPRIFSARGFATENISIVHPQTRSANLAWALHRRGRVGPGDVLAVVGGSFSGLMVAVALALTADAIVYVFEKEAHLLPRFRDKGHRHLSPVLNSRSLGEHYDPSYSLPTFRSPIFRWEKAPASEVAAQWLREFADYGRVLPIFTFCNTFIAASNLHPHDSGVLIKWDPALLDRRPIAIDVVIDATGFGEERNPHNLLDFSYWESGHRLSYDHVVPPAEILISGCGDSGVIEALHYALAEFRHEEVEALWPMYQSFGLVLDQLVERARLPGVLELQPNDDFEDPLLSEVSWWLNTRYHLEKNPDPIWPLDSDPHKRPIFETVERELAGDIADAFQGRLVAQVAYEELEEFAKHLPRDRHFAVRDAARPVIEHWISLRLADEINNIDLPPNIADFRAFRRKDVNLTLNGLTPTPYTRQLSPYNVWVMRLLMSCPGVRYHQGKIASVSPRPDRRLDATFDDGSFQVYDRVLTRYGAGGGVAIVTAVRRDGFAGDVLLNMPSYTVVDPETGFRGTDQYPVRDELLRALDSLVPVATSTRVDISKTHYVNHLAHGPDAVPDVVRLPADPQAMLSTELRNRRRPTYGTDSLTSRFSL
jgi:hypothetical protein